MKSLIGLLPLSLSILALSLVGCSSLKEDFAKGTDQGVVITSFPANAEVTINGEYKGQTPLRVVLPRKVTYEVMVEVPGYRQQVRYITPQPNAAADNFVKFGLLDDMGYYVDLRPGVTETELTHMLVPRSVGPAPFEEFALRVAEIDAMLEEGHLDPMEHRVITRQLTEVYLR